MTRTSILVNRPRVLRRVPVEVKLSREFLATLVRLEQTGWPRSGTETKQPRALIFGTVRGNCVTLKSLLQLDGLGAGAFATEDFTPGSLIGAQVVRAKRAGLNVALQDLVGWCLIGERSGLFESDLQFHNGHFRRISDLALLVRMDGQASWAAELYTRAFGGSLSPENHLSSEIFFSPLSLPEQDLEMVPGQGFGKKRSWFSRTSAKLPLSRVRAFAQRLRGFDGSAVVRRPAKKRGVERSLLDDVRPNYSRPRQLLTALAATLIVAATTVVIFSTRKPSLLSSARSESATSSARRGMVASKPIATAPRYATAINLPKSAPAPTTAQLSSSSSAVAPTSSKGKHVESSLHRGDLASVPSKQTLAPAVSAAKPSRPTTLRNNNVPVPLASTFAAARPVRQIMPPTPLSPAILFSDTDVRIEVTVSPEGRVLEAIPTLSNKVNQVLLEAAEEAAKQWLFQPATLGGQAVSSKYTIVFRFHTQH